MRKERILTPSRSDLKKHPAFDSLTYLHAEPESVKSHIPLYRWEGDLKSYISHASQRLRGGHQVTYLILNGCKKVYKAKDKSIKQWMFVGAFCELKTGSLRVWSPTKIRFVANK